MYATKRYRYTAKERDEESGLNYHAARYYSLWLCRWMTADPAGRVDGPNLYVFALNNPTMNRDPTGLQTERASDRTEETKESASVLFRSLSLLSVAIAERRSGYGAAIELLKKSVDSGEIAREAGTLMRSELK